MQLAAKSLLEQRYGFQKQLMSRVRRNVAEMDRQLSIMGSCMRLEVEGGWYAVLRVPAIRSDEDLAIQLLEEHGVYLHPGHFYGFPAEGYLVLSLIAPAESFATGLKSIGALLERD